MIHMTLWKYTNNYWREFLKRDFKFWKDKKYSGQKSQKKKWKMRKKLEREGEEKEIKDAKIYWILSLSINVKCSLPSAKGKVV